MCLGRWHIGMLENKPWSLQCVNWNKKISGKIEENEGKINFYKFILVKKIFQ